MELSKKLMSDIIIFMKYAKHVPKLKRRETFEEVVARNETMHIKKFPKLKSEIKEAYKFVYDRKVLPSLRSMQFAGKPIELNPARLFNCSYAPINHPYAFAEAMFLLLSGCFEENTPIITKDGIKSIKNITVYDEVLTYDTDLQKYYWICPFAIFPTNSIKEEKLELTMDDGSVIKCTASHLFYVKTRGWIPATDLTENDEIEKITEISNEIPSRECTLEELKDEYPMFFTK